METARHNQRSPVHPFRRCGRGESNPHPRKDQALNLARLPLRHGHEVRRGGLEPPRPKTPASETGAATKVTPPARKGWDGAESNGLADGDRVTAGLASQGRTPVPKMVPAGVEPARPKAPALEAGASASFATGPRRTCDFNERWGRNDEAPGTCSVPGASSFVRPGSYVYDTPSGAAKSSDRALEYQREEKASRDKRTIMERG